METEPVRKGWRVPPCPPPEPIRGKNTGTMEKISMAYRTLRSGCHRDHPGEDIDRGSRSRRRGIDGRRRSKAVARRRRARASKRWPRTHPRIGDSQACRTSSTRTCAPTWCVRRSKNPIARPRRLANRCTTVRRSGRKARWTSKVRAMETKARRERCTSDILSLEGRNTTRGAKVEKKRRRSVGWKNKGEKPTFHQGFLQPQCRNQSA